MNCFRRVLIGTVNVLRIIILISKNKLFSTEVYIFLMLISRKHCLTINDRKSKKKCLKICDILAFCIAHIRISELICEKSASRERQKKK